MDNIINTNTEVEEVKDEFIIPMNDRKEEELTEEEKKFLDDLDEKYKDRDDYKDTPIISERSDIMISNEDGSVIVDEVGALGSVPVNEDSAAIVQNIMEQGSKEIDTLPSDDKLTKELKDVYDMDDADILTMITILQRIHKKENFSIYNALPEQIKNLVKLSMGSNNIPFTPENRNIVAKALIQDILNDIKNDESFIEFDKAMAEIAEFPSILDFHAENYKDIMENKLIEVAENIKDSNPDKAQSLLDISNSWKDTYTFTRQYEFLENSESARNSITKNIEENYKNMTRDFTFKAEKSKFIINDVKLITRALSSYFGSKYQEYIYKAFVCLFITITGGLDFNNPKDISFVFYSIKNIISLEFVNKDGTGILEFNKELIVNLEKMLDKIVELDKIYQEKMANSTNKRIKRKMERQAKKKGGK